MVGERIEELVGEIPEQQTIFWVTPRHYAAFDAELRALYERPYHVDEQLRLFDHRDEPVQVARVPGLDLIYGVGIVSP